jgi:S-adenosylmethionine:tRNA ribosyltransferase-isomerase
LRLSDFAYTLPQELIAQEPLKDRAASRLLVLHRADGRTEHRAFRDVADLLEPGDLLVLNDTRVSALRVFGSLPTGGRVEALLIEDQGQGRYVALTKPAKKLRAGTTVAFQDGLTAKVEADLGEGRRLIAFEGQNVAERLADVGLVPLPPYVHKALSDPGRYQTVYAREDGSAAAPTAGLHFTEEMLSALRAKGVQTATVTLDVSLDTFRPVQTDVVEDHVMHGERCFVPEATAQAIANAKGRVIAVGTTTVRTLETMATGRRRVRAGETVSKLLIAPGFQFQVVDGLFTNFHMPGTTMLLLVAALAGRDPMLGAYREAVESKYRFLSFGDSMLVL